MTITIWMSIWSRELCGRLLQAMHIKSREYLSSLCLKNENFWKIYEKNKDLKTSEGMLPDKRAIPVNLWSILKRLSFFRFFENNMHLGDALIDFHYSSCGESQVMGIFLEKNWTGFYSKIIMWKEDFTFLLWPLSWRISFLCKSSLEK
jgi:hypothetical protein